MNEIALEKEQLRQQILVARKTPFPEHANLLTANLFRLVAKVNPQRVAIYQSYPSEPKTLDFIATANIPILIPVADPDGTLVWLEISSGAKTELTEGDLLIIPALAVDQSGNRLGRGKGYFDRALTGLDKTIPVYAVIFEREFLNSLPTEPHDRTVQGVISEVQIREIN